MMTNREIAKTFQFLGQIMELHGENKFKIRSYQNAYMTLRKLEQPLAELSDAEIGGIKGVGKAISGKIRELLDTGKMATLERYKGQTPEGVQEMLGIKGFGPKKIQTIWKDLGVESIGELLYAVNENRLIELKGFGKKTQDDLKSKLEYYQKSKNKYHYAALEAEALELEKQLANASPDLKVALTGATRRKANIQDGIALLAERGANHWQGAWKE
jgi:DNA polymerase (family 10)